jgi:SAM-dependent methyltransferase
MANPTPGAKGAWVYNRLMLAVYDIWVLGVVNTFAWNCSTKKVLLPFFKKHLSNNHLDIGPGTGYYLANSAIPPTTRVSVLDLNPNCLDDAKQALDRPDMPTFLADVLQPLPLTEKYDSISTFYLVHCLPRPLEQKMELFKKLKGHLTENGTVYGSTILGEGEFNLFGRFLMFCLNGNHVFDNRGDGEQGVREALKRDYKMVKTEIVGNILLFEASQPIF